MLTQRSLDVLLSCVDLRQELLEELEASSEPQQSLCGRVAHQGDVVLDFLQHDGLERGKAPRVRHQFLVNFLQGAETGRNVVALKNIWHQNTQQNPDDRSVFMLSDAESSTESTRTLMFPTKSILTGAKTVGPSLSEERKSLIISPFSFNQPARH